MSSRVPPHNLDAERSLLGAMLLNRDAREAVLSKITADALYKPGHGHVFDAIAHLAARDEPVDAVTVCAQLGPLAEQAGGIPGVMSLATDCPSSGNADRYADIVAELAKQRRVLAWAGEVTEAVYQGGDPAGLIARMGNEVAVVDAASTWQPVDLTPILEGDRPEIRPIWLHRADGAALLYPARVHTFNGESESGKSFLATGALVEAVRQGQYVLYVDWEDNASLFVEKLLQMGVTDQEISGLVSYFRPDEPFDPAARLRLGKLLDDRPFALAVLDGMAEALTLNGWDENSAHDVTAFFSALPRRIARAGAAVVLIDHVVKDKEKQGRYGRGSTAKLNGTDGAIYKLENIQPFGRGLTGRSRILLQRDRVGWIRETAGGHQHLADMILHSSGPRVRLEIVTPPENTPNGSWSPTRLMEAASRTLEGHDGPINLGDLLRCIPGSRETARTALDRLVEQDYVTRVPKGKNVLYSVRRPYRDPTNEPLGHPPDYMMEEGYE